MSSNQRVQVPPQSPFGSGRSYHLYHQPEGRKLSRGISRSRTHLRRIMRIILVTVFWSTIASASQQKINNLRERIRRSQDPDNLKGDIESMTDISSAEQSFLYNAITERKTELMSKELADVLCERILGANSFNEADALINDDLLGMLSEPDREKILRMVNSKPNPELDNAAAEETATLRDAIKNGHRRSAAKPNPELDNAAAEDAATRFARGDKWHQRVYGSNSEKFWNWLREKIGRTELLNLNVWDSNDQYKLEGWFEEYRDHRLHEQGKTR